ncbi:MAG TPA: c-type cytochrome [Stellaceae bacterium]|nr:c-type cytochrome [Stellaceae bacterium]
MPLRAAARRATRLALAAIAAIGVLPSGASRADDPPGSELFTNQCGTCHVISPAPEERQGPNLYGVIGRPAGKLKGFKYSPALAKAKFTWSKDKIDVWLTDTARLVPGSVMPYRQADTTIRARIIDYIAAAGGAAKTP